MKKEIQSLYVLKALSAFFVVLIHFPLFCQELIFPIIRTAVPVFFIISGYFLVAPDGSISVDKVRYGIIKMIKYVLLYNLLYLVFNYLCYGYFTIYGEYKKLFARAVLGSPFGYHLWYLTTYLEVLLCLYVVVKYVKRKFLLSIAPFLYLVGVVLMAWPGISILLGRNFVFWGIPCVLAGVYLRQHEQAIMHWFRLRRWKVLMVVFFLTYLEYALRHWVSINYGDYALLTLPFSCALFLFFISFDKTVFPQWLVSIGKKYSLDIYIYHVMVGILLLKVSFFEQLKPFIGVVIFLLSWFLSIFLHSGQRFFSRLVVKDKT